MIPFFDQETTLNLKILFNFLASSEDPFQQETCLDIINHFFHFSDSFLHQNQEEVKQIVLPLVKSTKFGGVLGFSLHLLEYLKFDFKIANQIWRQRFFNALNISSPGQIFCDFLKEDFSYIDSEKLLSRVLKLLYVYEEQDIKTLTEKPATMVHFDKLINFALELAFFLEEPQLAVFLNVLLSQLKLSSQKMFPKLTKSNLIQFIIGVAFKHFENSLFPLATEFLLTLVGFSFQISDDPSILHSTLVSLLNWQIQTQTENVVVLMMRDLFE